MDILIDPPFIYYMSLIILSHCYILYKHINTIN